MAEFSNNQQVRYLFQNRFLPDSHDHADQPQASDPALLESFASRHQALWQNLEYASIHPPANQMTGCLGRIDYIQRHSNNSIAVRGWLFHRELDMVSLHLSSGVMSVTAHAFRLERTDVAEIFSCFPRAYYSGFMAQFPETFVSTEQDRNSLEFRAKMTDGSVREGTICIL